MLLFVGLGNPGSEYARNRHNVGVMALDAIAKSHQFSRWQRQSKSLSAEGRLADQKVLLLVPETFMNASGEAVREAIRFSNVNESQVAVFHDDLETAFGVLRVRRGGGSRGHNGIRSINSILPFDYLHIGFGVDRPPKSVPVDYYVLSNFTPFEQEWMELLTQLVANKIESLFSTPNKDFEAAINQEMNARGFRASPKRSR